MRCGVEVVHNCSSVKKGFTGALNFRGVARKVRILGEVLITRLFAIRGSAGHRAAWSAPPRSAD